MNHTHIHRTALKSGLLMALFLTFLCACKEEKPVSVSVSDSLGTSVQAEPPDTSVETTVSEPDTPNNQPDISEGETNTSSTIEEANETEGSDTPAFDMSIFKSIGLIGDSYTSGTYSVINNGEEEIESDINLSWGNILAEKYGITPRNYGWGGATVKKWLEVPNSRKEAFDNDEVCDVYTIAFGINDKNKTGVEKAKYDPTFWYTALGSIDDEIGEDTFYAYLKEICEYVHDKAPHSPIFVITPYKYYKHWNEAIGEVADLYDYVYFADIYENCPYYVGDGSGYFGSHPTIEGHQMLAEYFDILFCKIINENRNDIQELMSGK